MTREVERASADVSAKMSANTGAQYLKTCALPRQTRRTLRRAALNDAALRKHLMRRSPNFWTGRGVLAAGLLKKALFEPRPKDAYEDDVR